MPELKPFQVQGSEFLSERRAALLADEMRLGKTAQSIRACDLLKAKKIYVTCPATVKYQWAREFEKWSERKLSVDILFGKNARINKHANVTILNYDLGIQFDVWNQMIHEWYGVAIHDESHYFGGVESQRTSSYLGRFGLASRAKYKWFLTGTPILKKPRELYPVLSAAAPQCISPYNSYESFTRHFCGGEWKGNAFGKRWVADGATNKAELHRRLKEFMLRRRKIDVFDQLPKKLPEVISIPQVGSDVKEMVREEFEFHHNKDALQGENYGVLRRELALYKVDFAVRHIRYVMEGTDKLVVFAHHRDVVKELCKKLEAYNPVIIMGGMPSLKKQANIDKFQGNKNHRILIGNIKAAGTGTDFSAADHMIFIEGSDMPGELTQALDRCDGFELDKTILIQFLVIRGSVEENIMVKYLEEQNDIDEVVDGIDKLLT